MSLKKLIAEIKSHNDFLISSHVNLEGDALGSELGLYNLIKGLGKNALIMNEDSTPYGYDYLPQLEVIRKYKDNLKGIKFDCFVALDCSDIKRTGEVYRLNQDLKCPVLNIDHHISNTNFGRVNWVQPHASCTCEMIFELYKKLKVKLDHNSALQLYTGIVADTGCFRYSNTTSNTHRIACELLKFDIEAARVYGNIYGNAPFEDIKLVAKVFNNVKRMAKGRIVWFEVKRGILKAHKSLCVDLTDYVMNFGRSIKDAEVVVLFKENLRVHKEVRVNFRSQGKMDVNEIAKFFGGGGHQTASGCTVAGRIDDVKRKILRKIEENL